MDINTRLKEQVLQQMNVRKRKKISENTDSMLLFHLQQYADGNLSAMELAIKCGQCVKINHTIKK